MQLEKCIACRRLFCFHIAFPLWSFFSFTRFSFSSWMETRWLFKYTHLLLCLRYKAANTIQTTAKSMAAISVKLARIGDIDTLSPFD